MALHKRSECRQDVAGSSDAAPGGTLASRLGAMVLMGVVAVAVVSCGGSDEPVASTTPQQNTTQPAHAKQWYEGGTLHEANGLEWQAGTQADKLATAGDILARINNVGRLSPQIAARVNNIDDYKPLAAELVTQLDEAFAPDPDPAENERLFANQTVSSTSVMVLALMGWVQTGG
ncbi:hypothetical protein [Pseudomonas abyssi]|uniref:hypothetical protein n=1 Tax=Pseudomonas abyssi TaxID=170540 RepID=UPI00157BF6B1|nr:hypothetical protein [Pseudomonas abyssi]